MSANCNWNQDFIPTNCQDYAIGGATGRVWIINKDAWDNATITTGTDGEITGITLTRTGDQSYKIETTRGSITTDSPVTQNAGGISGFTHTLNMVIPEMSQKMKNSISSLVNVNLAVVIVETQAPKPATSGTGDTKSPPYLVFGDTNGLELSTSGLNLGDQATGGSVTITLTSPAASQLELNLPVNTDMSTADIEAIETPVI